MKVISTCDLNKKEAFKRIKVMLDKDKTRCSRDARISRQA